MGFVFFTTFLYSKVFQSHVVPNLVSTLLQNKAKRDGQEEEISFFYISLFQFWALNWEMSELFLFERWW